MQEIKFPTGEIFRSCLRVLASLLLLWCSCNDSRFLLFFYPELTHWKNSTGNETLDNPKIAAACGTARNARGRLSISFWWCHWSTESDRLFLFVVYLHRIGLYKFQSSGYSRLFYLFIFDAPKYLRVSLILLANNKKIIAIQTENNELIKIYRRTRIQASFLIQRQAQK